MSDIFAACENLIKMGLAERLSGAAIQFTGQIDHEKRSEVERSYAEAFYRLRLADDAKEREAEKKFHDFVITY